MLDIGCGTGTFALMLAAEGFDVTGVDPALASLDVARGKTGSERVRWIQGVATDLSTKTSNVAQVFLTLGELQVTLRGIRAALKPGGWLVIRNAQAGRSCVGGVDAGAHRPSHLLGDTLADHGEVGWRHPGVEGDVADARTAGVVPLNKHVRSRREVGSWCSWPERGGSYRARVGTARH